MVYYFYCRRIYLLSFITWFRHVLLWNKCSNRLAVISHFSHDQLDTLYVTCPYRNVSKLEYCVSQQNSPVSKCFCYLLWCALIWQGWELSSFYFFSRPENIGFGNWEWVKLVVRFPFLLFNHLINRIVVNCYYMALMFANILNKAYLSITL